MFHLRTFAAGLIPVAILCLCASVQGDILVPFEGAWKYRKGSTEASAPITAWRGVAFDDSSWSSGPAPFFAGDGPGATRLNDLVNGYTTVFLRNSFQVANPAAIQRLALKTKIDDGFVAWINGQEVARFNVSAAAPLHTDLADSSIDTTSVTNSLHLPAAYLLAGDNVLTVQVFNRSLDSADLFFDAQLETVLDQDAPSILSVSPTPGEAGELTSVTVTFSEPVQGVSAEDVLINNVPASEVEGSGSVYTFTFDQPAYGSVDITWDEGHFITDLADPAHPFDQTAPEARWSYLLVDHTAPFVAGRNPPAGFTVPALTEIEVRFSEAVSGVDAADLLVNGAAASSVAPGPGNTYLFTFAPASQGQALVTWSAQHSIADTANPANPFVAQGWSYTVNPNIQPADVRITEFMASPEAATALKDEDNSIQDWVEIHNAGASAVNLEGWTLTDEENDPGKWTFPAVSLEAGARLVVFLSGKDRKPTAPGSRLHANFSLNTSGEYLGLFNSDSPRRVMTEFNPDYPEQRNDHSYGVDAGGVWKYFQTSTPGQPNGASTIVGVAAEPRVNIPRGTYDSPFDLVLSHSNPNATIRYTLDGSVPAPLTGQVYTTPLRIDKTTILRAVAFLPNQLPSLPVTHTYVYLDSVLRQPNNPPGFPVGPTVFSGYPSDYEMDPEIVTNQVYGPLMKDALSALPVLSVVMKVDDMFGTSGIYRNPLSRGPAWERPASIEFMQQDGEGFQINAGIQIQGNAAREPIKTPKHPMRIVFKGDYGPKNLEYKLFADSPVDKFDTLILRADFNNSWLHWNPTQRIRGQRTRDAWMKDTMRAMGSLASHNRYVHLYINGLYWGVYDIAERPDGSFGEAYLGGHKEDYDVINEGAAVDGNMVAYNNMLRLASVTAGNTDLYNTYKEHLDMPQFIDYMLLHFFVGHEDWGNNKNWYNIRPKNGSSGFKYLPWDGELVLGDLGMNRVSNTDVPSNLHVKLRANNQYRMDWADHAHRHFFNGGALTPQANIDRWMKRAREMELPIVAESARWGDYRRDVHQYQNPPYQFYTRDVQYRAEQNRLLTNYFINRTNTFFTQLRSAGLYPQVVAPSFNQHGGQIDPGFQLSISAPAGTIYYTTNGVDPRVYGSGELSAQALVYSQPVTLNNTAVVKSRVLNGNVWSALNEALFSTEGLRFPVRITEIMYHPPGGDAHEFIEIQNVGYLPQDISDFYLTGVDFVFAPRTVLQPGQIIVLASSANPASWTARYPSVTPFASFQGRLVDRGERVALMHSAGYPIVSVDYRDEDGWPEQADGDGASIEIRDPLADPDDPANWQAGPINGSPGLPAQVQERGPVVFNEVFATGADWVEFANLSDQAIDISGWSFTEAGGGTNIFHFPQGTILGPNALVVVHCNPSAAGFRANFNLDRSGEVLILADLAGQTRDIFSFGPQADGYTVARIDNAWALGIPTLSQPNQGAPLGDPADLVLNEWMADSAAGEEDWIELFNLDPELPVSLRGLVLAVGGKLFEITSHSFISPAGHVRLWADENAGPNHLDFKLPAAGDTLTLHNLGGIILDTVTYDLQADGVSMGRFPDGAETLVRFPVSSSPGRANSLSFPVGTALAGGEFTLSWPSVPGRRYRVEWSDSLLPASWTTLAEVSANAALSSAKELIENSRRYYRVIALPQ